MDVREAIRTQPMRRLQWQTVAVCLVLTMIDGFEILVMAFVAPHLAKAWHLSPVEVGYLLSAGVLGTALGAIFLSPLADRIGRRPHAIACLVLITLGMGLSAAAQNVPQLVAFRAFAGLSIGALVATLNITASEYSSQRRRGVVMGIYGIGLPAGAALGGALSGLLITAYGWRAPFIFGALITALMLVVVIAVLPESIDYLVDKRPRRALAQYNAIARRLGYAAVEQLPEAAAQARRGGVRQAIFGGVMARRTAFLWLSYALLTAAFYFANTWTAKLMADATGSPELGLRAGVLVPLGGVLGALLFAALTLVVRPRLATLFILCGGGAAFLAYANALGHGAVGLSLALALAVGVFANGGIAAFYAISPSVYPAAARGAGVGWMIGFGRVVSILSPLATGYLLASGWAPRLTYQLFAGCLLLAGLACWLLDRTYRGTDGGTESASGAAGASPEAAA